MPQPLGVSRDSAGWWPARSPLDDGRRNLLPALLSIAVAGISGGFVEGAFAQSSGVSCQAPDGVDVTALRNPPITARDVNDSSSLGAIH